jgi:hypothetical protein
VTSDPNLWALDIAESGRWRGRPVGAHLIVAARHEPFRGEVRVAACGEEFTAGTHPRGWWGTRWGRLPLQGHAVHCGADLIKEQVYVRETR